MRRRVSLHPGFAVHPWFPAPFPRGSRRERQMPGCAFPRARGALVRCPASVRFARESRRMRHGSPSRAAREWLGVTRIRFGTAGLPIALLFFHLQRSLGYPPAFPRKSGIFRLSGARFPLGASPRGLRSGSPNRLVQAGSFLVHRLKPMNLSTYHTACIEAVQPVRFQISRPHVSGSREEFYKICKRTAFNRRPVETEASLIFVLATDNIPRSTRECQANHTKFISCLASAESPCNERRNRRLPLAAPHGFYLHKNKCFR